MKGKGRERRPLSLPFPFTLYFIPSLYSLSNEGLRVLYQMQLQTFGPFRSLALRVLQKILRCFPIQRSDSEFSAMSSSRARWQKRCFDICGHIFARNHPMAPLEILLSLKEPSVITAQKFWAVFDILMSCLPPCACPWLKNSEALLCA